VRKYLILVVGVLVAAACIRLGIWQLDRLAQRRQRNAVTVGRLAEPVLRLDASAADLVEAHPDTFRFRRTAAAGTFDFGRQLVVLAQGHAGLPGIHVVTPLMLSDSVAVLVERGWLPSPDGRSLDTTLAREPRSSAVAGVLLRAESRRVGAVTADTWPRLVLSPDPESVARFYPYRILPLVIRRDSVPPETAALLSVSLPSLSNGPHLSYAIQWMAFATIALVGSAIFFVRGGGRRTTDHGDVGPPHP
jgi:surfeit locus 1 family protein